MIDLINSFGYWLRLQRKANDLTRERLAQLVFCSAETIRKIENEERRPSAQIVEKLAEIFHVPENEREYFLQFARGNSLKQPKQLDQPKPWQPKDRISKERIPVSTTTFLGREKEIKAIHGYLSDPQIRLISLIGPPGIGKTRLSLEIARLSRSEFSDGVFFVALDMLENPNLITTTILSSLGYSGKTIGHTNQLLVESIHQKQMLLILDNCEHLIETIAVLVADLLLGCPQLNIICTSREALRIGGEWQYKISTLDMPENLSSMDINLLSNYSAIALFSSRAKSALSDFSLQVNNVNEIFAICKKLDGLPLAIELIAPRIRFMSPKTLLEQISNQSALYSNGMRGLPPRQKTLHNAIRWSYELLPTNEQKLIRHLSVFSGSFSMESAISIFQDLGSGGSIPEFFSSLVDKSLVQHTIDSHNNNRFFMLVTIRQFFSVLLRQLNEEQSAKNHHLQYFLQLARVGERALRGSDQVVWINRLESELDNIRAAIDWAISQNDIESALRLLGCLGWFWEIRGHYQEARNWFYQIKSNPDIHHYPILYTKFINHIGRYCWLQGNSCNAEDLLNESMEISLSLGTEGEENLVDTLNWLALISVFQNNDTAKAKVQLEQAFSILENYKNEYAFALTTFHHGILFLSLNQINEAIENLQKSHSMFKNHGDLFFQSRASGFLGYQALEAGQFDKAYQYFDEHLKIDEALQFWDGIANSWADFGNLYQHQEFFDQAFQCYEESIIISEAHGLIKRDSYYHSGLIALHLNKYQVAEKHFKHVISLASKKGDLLMLKLPFMGLAGAKDGLSQLDQAAVLVGILKLFTELAPGEIPSLEQLEYDLHCNNTSEKLGEAIFKKLYFWGYSMTTQQAVDFALTA